MDSVTNLDCKVDNIDCEIVGWVKLRTIFA